MRLPGMLPQVQGVPNKTAGDIESNRKGYRIKLRGVVGEATGDSR